MLTATMLAMLSAGLANAQIFITSLPYAPATTNFDSYDPTPTNGNTTLPAGWTATCTGNDTYNGRGNGGPGGGSVSPGTGGYWAYGTSGTPGEYSLGALRSTTPGNITYAVTFTNASGTTIRSITLAWDYEQWRYANTSGWDCSGTGLLAGNTTLNSKDFVGNNGGTNGSATITQVASFILTGLNIPNGQQFGIKWVTTDSTGSDNGISIDNFTITASDVALPIDLLSFSAQRNGGQDRLSWSTTCQSTATQFSVERSDGNGDFKTLATLGAKGDPCNGQYQYRYDAPAQQAPLMLYRLAMRELSGALSYSQTVRVSGKQEPASLVLRPMPVQQHLFVDGAEPATPWQILNMQGQELKRGTFDASAIPLGELPPGHYFLRHSSGAVHFEKR
jgi:hypothetical protein